MTAQTATLADFLLARIAEDKEAVRGVRAPWWMENTALDPARMLAEREAKRRITELHGSDDPKWEGDCPWCGVKGPCLTLRALAMPYADHPDFRPEWRA